jgi:NAD(P)-dependent dehydrogenase (short-subunit alcohol dehydrogenase family)
VSARQPAYVVTGGTGALGRTVVACLLDRGDRVAVPYRDVSGFAPLKASPSAKDLLWGAQADVSDSAAARAFFDAAAERFDGLDGAALVAGAYAGGASFEMSPEQDWTRMMRANLESVQASCRALLPHLVARGGSVVSVGARLVALGGAGSAAYVASKAAVIALTRALAAENRARGVRFNVVSPGIIATAANRRAMPDADHSAWTPPEQIAAVIAFLLSPGSAPITGAEIPVDFRS